MAKGANISNTLSRAVVDEFELVTSQLERLYGDFQGIAKGKGNDAVNTFKLNLLNTLLSRANKLLGSSYEAVRGFEQFDSEQLPSTSDALIIVSQYLGALEKMRSDNIEPLAGTWYWRLPEGERRVRTASPAKLVKK